MNSFLPRGFFWGTVLIVVQWCTAFNVTGDITLIGLFKIHGSNGQKCGTEVDPESVMVAEAVKWYIQQLNAHGKLSLKIGFEAYETCQDKSKSAEIAVKVVDRVLKNEPIIGLIGPEFSSETEAVANILSSVHEDRRLPQVGFSATTTVLGDSDIYPNFVRVIPNDDVQVNLIIRSMLRLEWNRVAIIHEDDVYGESMKDSFVEQAVKVDICVSVIKSINVENGYKPNDIKSMVDDIVLGNGDRSYINGILYIGFSRAVNTMFYHLSNSPYSSVPIVMLSEGAGLNLETFSDHSNEVFSKAKGSLISSPTKHELTEFSAHWINIFTNVTVLEHESLSNPWLNELFRSVCATTPCRIRHKNQSIFVFYAITAAHALIKSAMQVKNSKCHPTAGLCDAFRNDFKQKYFLDSLKGISIDFDVDFPWRPESISAYSSTIGESGEISLSNYDTSWQLYNLRKSGSGSNQFVFFKVGEMLADSVDINFEDLRDYLESNIEVTYPNVRKAQCMVTSKCLECSPHEKLVEDALVELGDVYVVGIVPVFDKQGKEDCGDMRKEDSYQLVESIRLPVLQANEKSGDYRNFFPNKRVGLIVLNSCMSTAVIQRKIYNMHRNGVKLKNGTVEVVQNKILGFVAAYTSTLSMAVADTLSVLGYTQISYASTSPALSDREKYPYFMRVVTPDDTQAQAMVEIMKKLNVNYAQIIYKAGDYGEGGKNKVKELATENGICIVNHIALEDGHNPSALYEKLRKYAHAKLVIAFIYGDTLSGIINALVNQMKKGEFVFIGSEAWARNVAALKADTNQILLGSFTLSLEIYQDRELRSHIQDIKSLPYRENPWAQMYVQTKQDCYFDLSFDKSQSRHCADESGTDSNSVLDTYDTAAYIASTSLIIGANTFLTDSCGTSVNSLCPYYTPEGLVEEILNTKLDLDGSGSPMKVFDANGDGNVGYRIYNIQKDPDDPLKLVYREVGRYPLEGTFTFEMDNVVFATDDGLISKCPSEQTCRSCLQDDKKADCPVIKSEATESDDIKTIVLGTLLGVLGLVVLVLIGGLYRVRICAEKTPEKVEGYATFQSACAADPTSGRHYRREEVSESKVYLEIGAACKDARYSNQPSLADNTPEWN